MAVMKHPLYNRPILVQKLSSVCTLHSLNKICTIMVYRAWLTPSSQMLEILTHSFLGHAIWWDSFLCESDVDFLFIRVFVRRVYMKFSSKFSQQLLIADAWNFYTLFLLACHMVGYIFVWIRCRLPVCSCVCPYSVYEIFVAVFSATIHRRCLKF